METKLTVVQWLEIQLKKGIEDEFEFKAGKGLFSNFLFEKLEYKWIKYEITKDSTWVANACC
jgi:hypothetical protein